VMTFTLAWLLNLNLAATFAGSCLINNPWTMVPIYSADYFFGDFLVHKVFGCATVTWNPTWMNWINHQLSVYCGISNISLTAFLVGGNILGLMVGILLYPIMKRIFIKIAVARHGVRTFS
jgi:uncharacterized protein (DUF2062 family)